MKKSIKQKLQALKNTNFFLVSSPNGYGKTTNVLEFIKSYHLKSIWIDATTIDEIDLLWREIANHLFNVDKKTEQRLSTIATSEECLEIVVMKNGSTTEDIYVVVDNLCENLIHEMMKMLEILDNKKVNKIRFVVISEESLKDSSLSLVVDRKQRVMDKDFWFNEQDIGYLFKNEKYHNYYELAKTIFELSQGWPPGVYAMFNSYKKTEHIYDLTYINEYLFNQILKNKSHELIVELAKLFLFENFTMDFVRSVCKVKGIPKEILELQDKGLITREANYKDYKYQRIVKEAFRNYLDKNEFQIKNVFKQAGEWYLVNKEPLVAIEYFFQGKCFNEIVRILEEGTMSYMDIDPCLIQKVFECLPTSTRYQFPYVYLSYVCDCMTNIDVYTGLKLLNEFKRDLDENRFKGDKDKLEGEYHFIKAFSYFNDISKMMEEFKMAFYYFKGEKSKIAYPKMVATFGSCSLLYLYHFESGRLKDLVGTIESEVKYFTQIAYGVNAGSEFMVQAERNYEIGDYQNVISLAKTAYQEAKQFQQTSICINSLFTQGRWALQNQDKNLYFEIMKELKSMYAIADVPIVESELDCAISWLNILDNQLDQVSDWIKYDNVSENHLLHEAWTLSYVLRILYCIKKKDYRKLLNYCNILDNYFKEQMHVIGLIYVKLGKAIAYLKLDQKSISKENLILLFEITERDNFVSIFYEFKDEVLLLLNEYEIKDDYSRYIKTQLIKTRRVDDFKGLNSLTKKEYKVMIAFIDYGSYKEASNKLYISINTVKSHMKKVYLKLQINSREKLLELIKTCETNSNEKIT